MTKLIVALDGPEPSQLLQELWFEAGIRWFKVGPQVMLHPNWLAILNAGQLFKNEHGKIKIFLDLKLADTKYTVTESVKKFADVGISAISTFTQEATEAALDAACSKLYIWQVERLTDVSDYYVFDYYRAKIVKASGVICPGNMVQAYRELNPNKAIIVPGVRLQQEYVHSLGCTCEDIRGIADFAVVGRPIWMAEDPITVTKLYKEALADDI